MLIVFASLLAYIFGDSLMNRSWGKPTHRKYPAKKNHPLAGGNCPKCGKPLVIFTNKETSQQFTGCSGYPLCKYTPHIVRGRIDYVGESFPNGWTPNYSPDATVLIEKCASRPEMKFLFGAAYYLDHECGMSEKPMGLTLFKEDIVYEGKCYDAIRFDEPFQYWGGGTAPSAMAFVPQLEFAKTYHHDFGIFFADDHSASKMDWYLGLAVEVDFHPDHVLFPATDKRRDQLVTYPVMRLRPKIDEPLTWFRKVKNFWSGKTED
jgi:ssDNA-binding Zn-finger/Zn-ribbon topoisomerase 1